MLKQLSNFSSITLGKGVQAISRLRGGGSALPGLVVEKISPRLLSETLSKLPHGVVVITGTNGKTTTTKIVTELLIAQGLRVFTNNSGSNFVRGIISAMLQHIKLTGRFDYDIAVLELDEAHSRKFAKVAPVDYSLLLNISEDQTDRFGSTEHVARLLQNLAKHSKKAVVTNREDLLLQKISHKNLHYFGLDSRIRADFITEDQAMSPAITSNPDVVLQKISGKTATFKIGQDIASVELKLQGAFNAYNAAAALALVKTIFPDCDSHALVNSLSGVDSAFGRGELVKYKGQDIELLLVKNPASFQLSIASFAHKNYDYMVALNNHPADGQDISWLRKVNYAPLKQVQVCSGECAIRATSYLKEDGVSVLHAEPNLKKALNLFIKSSNKPKRIFMNYTAMMELRKLLGLSA